jgi:hypothetical protein
MQWPTVGLPEMALPPLIWVRLVPDDMITRDLGISAAKTPLQRNYIDSRHSIPYTDYLLFFFYLQVRPTWSGIGTLIAA